MSIVGGLASGYAQSPVELYKQGVDLYAQNRPAEAIEALTKSAAGMPKNGAVWKALGVVYASQGNYESAETPFEKACALEPALGDACLYYGRTLYLLNRFQPAIEVLRRVPQNAQAYRLIGLSQEALGEASGARQSFEMAVRLNGKSAGYSAPNDDPGIDYGVFLFRQGEVEESLVPLGDVLKRHPDAARAHLELGVALLALDRLTDAAAHLERAAALDPSAARVHLLLGKVYMRLGRRDAAEEHLRQGSLAVK